MSKFKHGMPITVRFNRHIRSDGEFSIVSIQQGEQEIQLTQAQIESLVSRLREKLLAVSQDAKPTDSGREEK